MFNPVVVEIPPRVREVERIQEELIIRRQSGRISPDAYDEDYMSVNVDNPVMGLKVA